LFLNPVSNLQGALGGQTGWSRHFFDPIPTGDGGELRTLRDAGVYILALPPAEAEREHWQIAMEFLISAAEKGGIVMMARIAMLRALNRGAPDPAPAPRRKRAKRYRIVNDRVRLRQHKRPMSTISTTQSPWERAFAAVRFALRLVRAGLKPLSFLRRISIRDQRGEVQHAEHGVQRKARNSASSASR
jgi:hypothetical protein